MAAYHIRLNSRKAVLILVGIWVLVAVVLANAYAGTLLSFMAVKKMGPVIDSIDELAHAKDVKLIVPAGADYTNKLLVNNVNYS